MFQTNVLLPTSIVRDIARTTDNQMTHLRQLARIDENVAAILPRGRGTPHPRLFDPMRAALTCMMFDLMRADVKAALAARIARRTMEAHQQDPAAEQWAIVVTENGNVSTLPYHGTTLSAGMVSGSRLSFALVVDLRSYADRVAAAIASEPKVIGGEYEAA